MTISSRPIDIYREVGNSAFSVQVGAGNISQTDQFGDHNWSGISQVGTGNVAVVHQSN